ncbi:hypothetical protein Pssp01_38480 [Pseudomonas sp. NBRC 100443]|nr:hypothetical protein Pssp01_38480 [Pseudomonas sp. NBRC 100443]
MDRVPAWAVAAAPANSPARARGRVKRASKDLFMKHSHSLLGLLLDNCGSGQVAGGFTAKRNVRGDGLCGPWARKAGGT